MSKVPGLIALALALSFAACSAKAAEKTASLGNTKAGHVGVGYTVAFLGIPFGHTQYDIHVGGNGYHTDSHFETSGIVSAFWQATIDATAVGQFTSTGISPAEYDSHY